jgi:hypothetical protein
MEEKEFQPEKHNTRFVTYMSHEEKEIQQTKIDQLERIIHRLDYLFALICFLGGLILIFLIRSNQP